MFGLDEGSESDGERDQWQKGNIWRQVGNISKYFGIPFEDILWKYSWGNLMMYSLSIPKTKKSKDDDVVGDIDISKPGSLKNLLG